ncbi:MAG TPA: 7-cyano-7-deazaguanine synthase QueC, partial [Tepidisphaeraceae bacterium]|nr:7-cyano-7-deazaguanine synthase QueC [Tepidisphaeraceae bacterium]
QRHEHELQCAQQIAEKMHAASHSIIAFDLRPISNSALTSADRAIPKGRQPDAMGHDIPVTYVPARNTIFLSFALAKAETIGARDIFIGVNALDYSGYPDCRPEYIRAFETMANLATKAATQDHQHLTIHAPLISMTKAQIIRRGLDLGVDYSLTTTCYDPSPTGHPCGQCDACTLRLQGFAANGLPDPTMR